MKLESRIDNKKQSVNNIDDLKNTMFDKKEWHVEDIIYALILFLIVSIFFSIIKHVIYIIHDDLYSNISASIAGIITSYILNRKYPLKIFSETITKNILKYSFPAFLICFMVYLPFYYNVWNDNLTKIPEEYNRFMEFKHIEKMLFIINLCLLAPTVEEILFRGFFYRILRNRYNIFWGTTISTTIFYLFHGLGPFNINIILVSLVFTYVYEKSGNIWTSIVTHSLNNIAWFVLVFLGISR